MCRENTYERRLEISLGMAPYFVLGTAARTDRVSTRPRNTPKDGSETRVILVT